jgi:hypothetical protein
MNPEFRHIPSSVIAEGRALGAGRATVVMPP